MRLQPLALAAALLISLTGCANQGNIANATGNAAGDVGRAIGNAAGTTANATANATRYAGRVAGGAFTGFGQAAGWRLAANHFTRTIEVDAASRIVHVRVAPGPFAPTSAARTDLNTPAPGARGPHFAGEYSADRGGIVHHHPGTLNPLPAARAGAIAPNRARDAVPGATDRNLVPESLTITVPRGWMVQVTSQVPGARGGPDVRIAVLGPLPNTARMGYGRHSTDPHGITFRAAHPGHYRVVATVAGGPSYRLDTIVVTDQHVMPSVAVD